jgi:hypothetical protein
MDDHERNLCDFYAGLAMLGLLISGNSMDVADESWEIAHAMMHARTPAEVEEGIVALKPKRKRSK